VTGDWGEAEGRLFEMNPDESPKSPIPEEYLQQKSFRRLDLFFLFLVFLREGMKWTSGDVARERENTRSARRTGADSHGVAGYSCDAAAAVAVEQKEGAGVRRSGVRRNECHPRSCAPSRTYGAGAGARMPGSGSGSGSGAAQTRHAHPVRLAGKQCLSCHPPPWARWSRTRLRSGRGGDCGGDVRCAAEGGRDGFEPAPSLLWSKGGTG